MNKSSVASPVRLSSPTSPNTTPTSPSLAGTKSAWARGPPHRSLSISSVPSSLSSPATSSAPFPITPASASANTSSPAVNTSSNSNSKSQLKSRRTSSIAITPVPTTRRSSSPHPRGRKSLSIASPIGSTFDVPPTPSTPSWAAIISQSKPAPPLSTPTISTARSHSRGPSNTEETRAVNETGTTIHIEHSHIHELVSVPESTEALNSLSPPTGGLIVTPPDLSISSSNGPSPTPAPSPISPSDLTSSFASITSALSATTISSTASAPQASTSSPNSSFSPNAPSFVPQTRQSSHHRTRPSITIKNALGEEIDLKRIGTTAVIAPTIPPVVNKEEEEERKRKRLALAAAVEEAKRKAEMERVTPINPSSNLDPSTSLTTRVDDALHSTAGGASTDDSRITAPNSMKTTPHGLNGRLDGGDAHEQVSHDVAAGPEVTSHDEEDSISVVISVSADDSDSIVIVDEPDTIPEEDENEEVDGTDMEMLSVPSSSVHLQKPTANRGDGESDDEAWSAQEVVIKHVPAAISSSTPLPGSVTFPESSTTAPLPMTRTSSRGNRSRRSRGGRKRTTADPEAENNTGATNTIPAAASSIATTSTGGAIPGSLPLTGSIGSLSSVGSLNGSTLLKKTRSREPKRRGLPSIPKLDLSGSNFAVKLTTATPALASAIVTARPIANFKDVVYPTGVKPPREDLNKGVDDGRFRYDRDFLMQFLTICTEQPENMVKLDTIGLEAVPQTPAATSSQRGHRRRGSRSTGTLSNAPPLSALDSSFPFTEQLVPGTPTVAKTSEERFALSLGTTPATPTVATTSTATNGDGIAIGLTTPLAAATPSMSRTGSRGGRSRKSSNKNKDKAADGSDIPPVPSLSVLGAGPIPITRSTSHGSSRIGANPGVGNGSAISTSTGLAGTSPLDRRSKSLRPRKRSGSVKNSEIPVLPPLPSLPIPSSTSAPLTPGLAAAEEYKPLEMSANRWVPNSLGNRSLLNRSTVLSGVSVAEADPPELVERKVKSLLNKLTLEKFDGISDQIVAWANKSEAEVDGETLQLVIKLVFEKATDEATWSGMYARLCRKMMEQVSLDVIDEGIRDREGNPVAGGQLFRQYLLSRCQADFERGWSARESLEEQQEAAAMASGAAPGEVVFSDEYYALQKAKRRGLGLVKFIGELFKLQMLTERIMHRCILKLLDEPAEEDIESACQLLITVGASLSGPKGKEHMDRYFEKMEELSGNMNLSSRIRFMLLDVIDLRARNWVSRNQIAAPTTIAEVHEAAAKETSSRPIPVSRGSSRRGQNRSDQDGWNVGAGSTRSLGRNGGMTLNTSLSPPNLIDPNANLLKSPVTSHGLARNPSESGSRRSLHAMGRNTSEGGSLRMARNTSETGSSRTLHPVARNPSDGGSLRMARVPSETGTSRMIRAPSEQGAPRMSRVPSEQGTSRMTRVPSESGTSRMTRTTSETGKSRSAMRRESSNRGSRRGQTLDFDKLDAAVEAGSLGRRKLNLLPRSVGLIPGSVDSIEETIPESSYMTEEQAKTKIEEDVKELFQVRDLDEGVGYFELLPAEHRYLLVDKLVSRLDAKESDIVLILDLFSLVSNNLDEESFEKGFLPTMEFLDDIAVDVPHAYSVMARMLQASKIQEPAVGRLADTIEGGQVSAEKLWKEYNNLR